jgi:arylsulfatase A-like enzyme
VPRPPLPLGEGIGIAAWCGIATGVGELAYQGVRKFYLKLFLFQPIDALWMTPMAEALIFVAIAAAGYAVFSLRGRRPTAGHVVAWCSSLAAMALLFLFPPLHRGAAIIIALGIGLQLGRSRLADARWPRVLVRRTLPILIGLLVVGMIGLPLRRMLAERRALAALPAARAGAPNVLLIILDTVRSLDMSLYGYPRSTTPALEDRAKRGTLFLHALSPAPWTLPSHASMFTGRPAHELSTDWYVALDDSTPTLAEVLRDHGWRTGGFVANLPYTNREVGLGRGFTRYEDYPVSVAQLFAGASLVRAVTGNDQLRDWLGWYTPLVQKPAPEIGSAFLRWADADRRRPFFAFLNYYDAHKPVVPPEPFASRFLPPGSRLQPEIKRRTSDAIPWDPAVIAGALASYDGAIAYLDSELEQLFRQLEARGLLENTLVIVTSDHGEEFAEHGLIDHGNSLYRPALEVPLLLWGTPRVPAGATVNAAVSTTDLASTVLDLLGLTTEARLPGRSLARYWTPGADTMPEPIFAEVRHAPRLPAWYPSSRGDMMAVLSDGLRYIRNGDGAPEVFDFVRDTAERHNLADTPAPSDTIRRLRAVLDSARPLRR